MQHRHALLPRDGHGAFAITRAKIRGIEHDPMAGGQERVDEGSGRGEHGPVLFVRVGGSDE